MIVPTSQKALDPLITTTVVFEFKHSSEQFRQAKRSMHRGREHGASRGMEENHGAQSLDFIPSEGFASILQSGSSPSNLYRPPIFHSHKEIRSRGCGRDIDYSYERNVVLDGKSKAPPPTISRVAPRREFKRHLV